MRRASLFLYAGMPFLRNSRSQIQRVHLDKEAFLLPEVASDFLEFFETSDARDVTAIEIMQYCGDVQELRS